MPFFSINILKSLACSEHHFLVAAVLAMPELLCAFLLYQLIEKLIMVQFLRLIMVQFLRLIMVQSLRLIMVQFLKIVNLPFTGQS